MLPATIINGQLQTSTSAKAAEMLLQQPKGPYTTAHITAGGYVEAWQMHMLRLAQAVLRLHQLDGAAFDQLVASLQEGNRTEVDLQEHLDARIRLDLAALAVASTVRMAVTILLCSPPASSCRALDVVVHAMALPPALPAPPEVEAAVVGPERSLPDVKHSQWVADRQQYTPNMPDTAAEGLLCDSDGRLLEGLITNLFVVAGDSSGGITVVTASDADGVLGGIMRRYVLRACAALSIPVVQEAPHWSSHASWLEAFLTNSLRGLQPLSRIVCKQLGLCGDCQWIVLLPPQQRDSVTDAIRSKVQELLAAEAVPLHMDYATL